MKTSGYSRVHKEGGHRLDINKFWKIMLEIEPQDIC